MHDNIILKLFPWFHCTNSYLCSFPCVHWNPFHLPTQRFVTYNFLSLGSLFFFSCWFILTYKYVISPILKISKKYCVYPPHTHYTLSLYFSNPLTNKSVQMLSIPAMSSYFPWTHINQSFPLTFYKNVFFQVTINFHSNTPTGYFWGFILAYKHST